MELWPGRMGSSCHQEAVAPTIHGALAATPGAFIGSIKFTQANGDNQLSHHPSLSRSLTASRVLVDGPSQNLFYQLLGSSVSLYP